MSIVKVTRKYQITLPRNVREELGIRIGDFLKVKVEKGRVILEPLTPRKKKPIEDILSIVSEPVDIDAVKLVEES